MTSAMRCIEAAVLSLLSLPSGTRLFSQFSLKCTASPESSTAPVLGSLTSRLWWPGVCPGRGDDHHAAVAEDVVIAFELGHRYDRDGCEGERRADADARKHACAAE